MRRDYKAEIARVLLLMTVALWYGGLCALFLLVVVLFDRDRAAALAAGPAMFDVFDVYQWFLAPATVLFAGLLLWARRGAASWVVFMAALLTAAAAAAIAFWIMPEINGLMASDRVKSERFHTIHAISILLYLGEAVLLLLSLIILSAMPAQFKAPA